MDLKRRGAIPYAVFASVKRSFATIKPLHPVANKADTTQDFPGLCLSLTDFDCPLFDPNEHHLTLTVIAKKRVRFAGGAYLIRSQSYEGAHTKGAGLEVDEEQAMVYAQIHENCRRNVNNPGNGRTSAAKAKHWIKVLRRYEREERQRMINNTSGTAPGMASSSVQMQSIDADKDETVQVGQRYYWLDEEDRLAEMEEMEEIIREAEVEADDGEDIWLAQAMDEYP